jgi:hypothetical protein
MTYPAIRFIEGRIHREMVVFEYGAGNSTLWWASRVRQVVSCEHDRQWHDRLASLVPANVELLHVELVRGGEYSKRIATYEAQFDVIVIDGRDRVACARHSIGALNETGVIIWDDSDREQYGEGYDFLLANGFKRIDFEGIVPGLVDAYRTAIFYRPGNCLGI